LPGATKILPKYGIGTPLNWYCLFVSALCFTIGNIIYMTRCPKIIKEHIAFTGFLGGGKTYLHLEEYKKEINSNITLQSDIDNEENDLKNDFWAIHKEAEFYKKCCLWWCGIFYISGFICVVIAVILQIFVVIKSYPEVVQQLRHIL